MKKSSVLVIATALLLSSCGMVARYASSDSGQKFQDGIYNSTPDFSSKADKAVSKAETDALVEKTKASRIYLFGEKKDTVMIPENMSARIQYDKELGSTVVTVGENPYDWQNNINPWSYYTPYSIGSSWYWSRHYNPWYWDAWSYNPWYYRYGGWYGGWYDPWYYGYGGWHDPWYYGYAGWYGGWYDPWYGYMYPHYCGWYGGWDPYWGHHHHGPIYIAPDRDDVWRGPRRHTGSDRVFTSRVSTRGGTAGSGATRSGRVVTASSSTAGRTSAVRVASGTASRTSAVRTTSSTIRKATASATRQTVSTGQALTDRSTTASSNHRRPTVIHSTGTFRSGTSAGSSQAVRGSTAPYRSSSSSYSNSSSGSRSSYSSGSSSSRSSYSGGSGYSGGSSSRSGGSYSSGGASRSGGSSAGRR